MPEVITGGKTEEQAFSQAQEALGLALRGRYADRMEIPPANYKGGIAVSPDAWDTLKLSVLAAFAQAGISKTELSARLGKQETEARRILDPYHFTKMQTLERALAAMGKQVVITVCDAVKYSA